MSRKIKATIIGAGGYWSQNVIRNLLKFPDVELLYAVDSDYSKLEKIKNKVPYYTQLLTDYHVALANPDVEAVLIITPVSTHYQIAKDSINAGKHVYLQKPSTETVPQIIELTQLARDKKVKLMTAFTFCFHNCIKRLSELKSVIGKLYYYDSTRINLGLIQRDCNVIADLFAHDAAILYYLTGKLPEFVSAVGKSHNKNGFVDVASISMGYENGFVANWTVNWLSPVKNRTIILAGENKMAVFDDCSNEPLKIYDSGFRANGDVFDYRVGDVLSPKVKGEEAIYNELNHYFESIKYDWRPLTDGEFSIQIVKMIEAANKSIEMNGNPVSPL